MKRTEIVRWITLAIASMEGFFVTPEQWRAMKRKLPAGWKPGDPITSAQRNNNPGNLRSWAKIPTVGGFAQFATAEDGWKALQKQAANNIWGRGDVDTFPLRKNGLTFLEFFAGQRDATGSIRLGGYPGYAPAFDGNQSAYYAEYVLSYIRSRSGQRFPELTVNHPIKAMENES